MNKKAYLDLAKDVIAAVEADLLDPVTGEFKAQPDLSDDSLLVQAVESAYIAHGGVISDNVKKVIAGIVAVLAIA